MHITTKEELFKNFLDKYKSTDLTRGQLIPQGEYQVVFKGVCVPNNTDRITFVFSLKDNPSYLIGKTTSKVISPISSITQWLKMLAPDLTFGCINCTSCLQATLSDLLGSNYKAYLAPSDNRRFMNILSIYPE